jgi:hypothetical protein
MHPILPGWTSRRNAISLEQEPELLLDPGEREYPFPVSRARVVFLIVGTETRTGWLLESSLETKTEGEEDQEDVRVDGIRSDVKGQSPRRWE